MNESKVERQMWVAPQIKDYYLSVKTTIKKCVVSEEMSAPERLIDSKLACP